MFNFLNNSDEYKRLMKLELLMMVIAAVASVVLFKFGVLTGTLFGAIASAFFLMDAIVARLRLLGVSRGFSRFIGTVVAIPALAGYLMVILARFPIGVA
ncbi:hypothetical protein BVJ53_06810 [Lacticaseibacillus chiayiensis]|uniref:Uncharacterized protein n=1 Tax=Lacticaseibacillus chiayiensis TaxID=2100821 RepID=A0A4Q1U1B9_9LACO|nr:hypothetical protein [Lacticaseibacillus chiayiensis]QVI34897.1 hypothetical protein KG086_00675 [Lacticaseibacillus chiayiensis]RXT24953.1 hypothetical protein BVJ53_06810 [Lacticaseibacillus chiayiensis]RXT58938.1 hypothetical protein CHT97_03710 [Lacticaseibacillus chiayiensis]UYN56655.1 hypothetical protein OFW50_00680 [Lacticaseibacillus chiayiensis]